MNLAKQAIRQTALAAAITASLGTAVLPTQTHATVLTFSVNGWFTLVDPSGVTALNNSDAVAPPMYGWRTPVSGTLAFDTTTNNGTMSLAPFSFASGGNAIATNISFQDIDGPGGAGTLVLGNMGFNWSGSNGIPVSIVWDQAGLQEAVNAGIVVGQTVGTTGANYSCDTNLSSCASAATEGLGFGAKGSYTLPLGPVPIASTTFNTTDIGTVGLGTNPSGTLPLTDDGFGGSPMKAGPFPGWNANFEFSSMKLDNDGSGSIDAPVDVSTIIPDSPNPVGGTSPIDLGVPSNVTPTGTAEYCTAGVSTCDAGTPDTPGGWNANNGSNTINVPITQTINTVRVDWRSGGGVAFASPFQKATVTVNDVVPPVIDSSNAQSFSIQVSDTAQSVCFGAITATDNIEQPANLVLEWSLDGFNWNPVVPADNCSSDFGPNDNTVTWRAIDVAGNTSTYQQTVTLDLPAGIVGKACTLDLSTAGSRAVNARFTMRNPYPTGAITPTGVTDITVTGQIDTTLLCIDETCTTVGAALTTTQPFYGSLWSATPIRLFGPGDYTFETCPLPRENAGTVANPKYVSLVDGSTNCVDLTTPMPMTMHVGTGQLGAHMLFEWSGNQAIDVVNVWDVDCKQYMLTTTDPDGDGILGSPMVDGPFGNWNAAFDLKTATGVMPIAEGGFTTSIPAVQNPVSGSSPLPLTVDNSVPATDNPAAVRSCVGGCFGFTTTQLQSGTDGAGAYQYAQVVLPLSEAIPFWSQYFMYNNGSWSRFVIDGRNNVMTAPMVGGSCPEPGGTYNQTQSGRIDDQLTYGHGCVQLTIEDGGPNDTDGTVNASVTDPGGVAEVPAAPLPSPKTSGGGCSLSSTQADAGSGGAWWLLGSLLGWLGWKRRKSAVR